MLNRIKTKEMLIKWGMNVDELCVFCQVHYETRDHLFSGYDNTTNYGKLFLNGKDFMVVQEEGMKCGSVRVSMQVESSQEV